MRPSLSSSQGRRATVTCEVAVARWRQPYGVTRGTAHATSSKLTTSPVSGQWRTVNMTLKSIGCAGAVLLALAACGRDQRPPEVAMAEARESESGSAVESITEARCARESRCDNVGPDLTYS